MKLKAPQGVGDPCVAGVVIVPRDGIYAVEPEVGALLIECFGFVEVETPSNPSNVPPQRGKPLVRKPLRES
jgi:hypothetical protein